MLVPMLMYVPLLSIFPLPSIGDKLAARYWSDHGRIHGQSDIMSSACHMAQKCKMRNQFDAGIVGCWQIFLISLITRNHWQYRASVPGWCSAGLGP